MRDQFPRPPADEEELEACHNLLARRVCQAGSDGADGWCCTRRPGHAGKHVAAGTMESDSRVLVLATWPQAPNHAGAPAAVTLRGTVAHRFADGGMSIAIAGDAYGRAGGQRFVHLSPDESAGLNVGDKVNVRIEVTRE